MYAVEWPYHRDPGQTLGLLPPPGPPVPPTQSYMKLSGHNDFVTDNCKSTQHGDAGTASREKHTTSNGGAEI